MISFISLLAMTAFLLCMSVDTTFAMGANGGPYAPEGGTKATEEGAVKNEKKSDKKSGEEAAGEEKKGEQTGQPSQKKKPRLKYRDMYECGC